MSDAADLITGPATTAPDWRTRAPMCAVCNKTVYKFEWDEIMEPIRHVLPGGLIACTPDESSHRVELRVFCHGEQESMVLNMIDLYERKVIVGVAFRTKRIGVESK